MKRFLFLAACGMMAVSIRADERPNIVWIVCEDQSRHYGCYGEPLVDTPAIDRLAAEGALFVNAAVTAPVCSPCRSALVTGMWQTSIGAHHHRSGRGAEKIHLPEHVRLIPEYFKEAGYYTCIGSLGQAVNPGRGGLGKTDYNFQWDSAVYDAGEWSGRAEGQPFFAQIMLGGGKSRNSARRDKSIPHVNADDVVLPPYYPRHPVILEDWAAYLDTFTQMDRQVAQVLARLEKEGLAQNTVVFFMTDHGISHARGKQFCYDEGMMIPLIVWAPGRIEPGTVRRDLALQIDLAATSMHFAGIPIPDYLESRPLFGPDFQPRDYLVCARDRCDETYDRIRAVRDERFKYIRNGYPQRPHLQPNVYKDEKSICKALREWHAAGKLDALQERILFSPQRAEEELYDLASDPWELNNLAGDPAYAAPLARMRQILDRWIEETGDRGQQVEPMAMYDSDMKVYLDNFRLNDPRRAAMIEANIALMKQWWSEGK